MRLRRRHLLLAVLLGMALTVLPSVASSNPSLTGAVHAVNEGSGYGYGETHRWSPPEVTVAAGGGVTISNPTAVRHGVNWINPPAQPACDGKVPVGTNEAASGTQWSGECKFAQPGAYTFYCTVHGSAMSGTIIVPGTPKATTEQPVEVTQTGASLRGTVNPQGEATEYRFEYGTSTVSEHTTGAVNVGSTDFNTHVVSTPLTGLSPSEKYRVELVSIYGLSKITVSGGEQMFTTPAVQAPSVTTGQATVVMQISATLNGTVSPEGQKTAYFFKYGLGTSYENVTPIEHTGPEGVSHAALAPVMGLLPDTEYHFQLYAENGSDVSVPVGGGDHTFKTASVSSPPSPAPTPTPTPSPSTTTTASTAAFPPTTTILFEPPIASPLVADSLKLTSSRHGSSVHGSIDISQAGTGGRLEVDLLANSASLARRGHSRQVTVGRLVRTSLYAGKVSFSVSLNAKAKRALSHHRRLALTVQIVLTPAHGSAVTVARSVVLQV